MLAILLALILGVAGLRGLDGLFLGPPVIFFLGVAGGSHSNLGHRQILPLHPFLHVLIGGLAIRLERRWLPVDMAILAVGSVVPAHVAIRAARLAGMRRLGRSEVAVQWRRL